MSELTSVTKALKALRNKRKVPRKELSHLQALQSLYARFGGGYDSREYSHRNRVDDFGDPRHKPFNRMMEYLELMSESYCSHEENARNRAYSQEFRLKDPVGLREEIKAALSKIILRIDKSAELNVNNLRLANSLVRLDKILSKNESGDWENQLRTGQIKYKTHGEDTRLYSSFTNIPSSIRVRFLAEYSYIYDYDISSASLSILYQKALMLSPKSTFKWIPFYLANKTECRWELASKYKQSRDTIKELLTAIVNGARWKSKPFAQDSDQDTKQTSVISILKGNQRVFDRMSEDEFLQGYRKEISKIWSIIGDPKYNEVSRTMSDETNIQVRLSNEFKANYYFRQEALVMNIALKYLRSKYPSIKLVHEHDGFRSDIEIDIDEVKSVIKTKTGYDLDFSKEVISTSDSFFSRSSLFSNQPTIVRSFEAPKDPNDLNNLILEIDDFFNQKVVSKSYW